MKCLRCGKEVPDDMKICDNCGFDLDSLKNYKSFYVEVDPEVDKSKRISMIDGPILTFILGLACLINCILILGSGRPIPLLYIITFAIFFGFCFFCSTKPAKVKLKPFRELGIIFAYISLVLTLIDIISWLISL